MTKLEVVKPAQMQISAFLDKGFTRPVQPAPNIIKVQYDSKTLRIKQDNIFGTSQGPSTSSAQSRFYACSSRHFSVTLSFNGVNFGSYGPSSILGQEKADVAKEVGLFLRLCQQINGHSHEPSYLRLIWAQAGIQSTFESRLKNYDLSYTLIDRDGKPLLAEIAATFVEAVDSKKQQARLRLSSPDLSHRHLVLAGETLPMLCLRYYGTTAPYLKVAAFNQLDGLRTLIPGIQVLFPPLTPPGGRG